MQRGITRDSLLFSFIEQFNAVLDPLEEGGILARSTLWAEDPGGLWSIGLQRVRHDWSDLVCMHLRIYPYCCIHFDLTLCFWDQCVFLYVLPVYCSDCYVVCQNVHPLIPCICLIIALLRCKSHTTEVTHLEWFLVQNCAPLTPSGSSSAFYLFILPVMDIQITSNPSVSQSIWW